MIKDKRIFRIRFFNFVFERWDTSINKKAWDSTKNKFVVARGMNFRSFDYKGFHLCIPMPSLSKEDWISNPYGITYKRTIYGKVYHWLFR